MEARMKPVHAPTARTNAVPQPLKALSAVLALAAVALLLLVPDARAAGSKVVWGAPTHPDQHRFTAKVGKPFTFALEAKSSTKGANIVIEPVGGLPAGASIGTSMDGRVAKATFRWLPEDPGDYELGFVAKGGGSAAPVRTYLIRVRPVFPYAYRLTDDKVAYWTPLLRATVARTAPRSSARAVTKLGLITPDTSTRNLVLVLDVLEKSETDVWYHVRLPMLPNNTLGWVNAKAVGSLYEVNTHLYIDRAKLVATLERDGETVFKARIGVGKASTPTPRGEFYVRGKLTHFDVPFYGPIVFGLSARSASNEPEMLDWPGDGFVGVHGTSLPHLIPGRPSHGCIRLKNEDIAKLAKLMTVGTPVTIR
jgi:hypothetical protein